MQQTKSLVTNIPFLGVGLGYRHELKEEIFAAKEEIDFLEIPTDAYTGGPQALEDLRRICEVFPVIPHGTQLSIGSVMLRDEDYLQAIKRISDLTQSPYYSEHLCVTRVPGIDIGHLSPLWFTEETLEQTIKNVSDVQEYLGKPLILENVTYFFDIPNASMSQTVFFKRLVEATSCGVLLDVTNIYINAVNHRFDPIRFLEEMPLENTVQVHLAGGYWAQDYLIDGHCELVQEESWDLLKLLASRCKVRGVIFEYDANFPEMAFLLQQIQRAKEIIA